MTTMKAQSKTRSLIIHDTHNTLEPSVREAVAPALSAAMADCMDLYTQLKQAHWNVKGPGFIALHELFDQIAGDVLGYVDELAERLVVLGGQARGTARAVAANSLLPEYPLDISDQNEHIAAVSKALAQFGDTVRKAIDTTDDAGDPDTADLFTGISRAIDKWLWFVESHAQR